MTYLEIFDNREGQRFIVGYSFIKKRVQNVHPIYCNEL